MKTLEFEEWRDNSLNNNLLRFRFYFKGFSFNESRAVSEEAIRLASKLADQLEKDLKLFNDY